MDEYIYMRDLDGCPEERCPLKEYCTQIMSVPAEMRLDPVCSDFGNDEKIEDVLEYLIGGVGAEDKRREEFHTLHDDVKKKYAFSNQAFLNAERNINEAMNTRLEVGGLRVAWGRAKERTPVAKKLAELGHDWYDLNPMLFKELVKAHYTGSGKYFLSRL